MYIIYMTALSHQFIAVADKYEINRGSISYLLKKNGFYIGPANAKDASPRERLQAPDEAPYLIVMDICIPEMNGYETAGDLKVLWPLIRSFVQSPESGSCFPRKLHSVLVNAFVRKEISFCELLKTVKQFIKKNT